MPSPDDDRAGRDLDSAAVHAALRRLGRGGQVPWLHGEVAVRMAQRLQLIRLKPSLILEWWGRCGASSAALQGAFPQARRVVVEPTMALLDRSAKAERLPWWSARRWSTGGAEVRLEAMPLMVDAQLVWANMMLHAVDDPLALFGRWQRALRVDGFVMFSCLGPGTLRELRALYKRLAWGPPAQGFIDMHDLGDMLVHSGFADPVMDQEVLSLRWDSPQALLDELRGMGGNAAPARYAGLRTPRWRDRLLVELEALRGPDGRIALSFEVAYGHAFKAAPRVRVVEKATVSLDDMRAMVRSPRDRR
jgi:malonyl-CoA O-methyltransferase